MIPIMEFQKRSLNGPVMKADEFDLAFSSKLRELVLKYDITYTPEVFIVDDTVADAVFQAGVELLAEIGLYHMETQRVIKYTEDEIRNLAEERKENPCKITMGSGDDTVNIRYRTGDDTRPPINYAGAAGVLEEEWFMPFVQSFAQESSVKGMGCTGGITKVGDVTPKAGTLSELHCGLWEQERMIEVLKRVGIPGLSLMDKADTFLGQEPPMELFPDKYDVKTVQPKPEYETRIMTVKEDLARMGIPYK